MQERSIPVKVLDGLVSEVIRWIEVNRPVGVGPEEAARWILSAVFSSVTVAGAACAGLQALGGEISEQDFLELAREAFRRAQPSTPGASA